MPVLISEDMKTALSKPFQQQFIVNQLQGENDFQFTLPSEKKETEA